MNEEESRFIYENMGKILQGRAKVSGHLDFAALIGRFSTFLITILNLHVNTFILAYFEPKLAKNYSFWHNRYSVKTVVSDTVWKSQLSAISIFVTQSLKIGLERPKIRQNDPKNMQIVDIDEKVTFFQASVCHDTFTSVRKLLRYPVHNIFCKNKRK